MKLLTDQQDAWRKLSDEIAQGSRSALQDYTDRVNELGDAWLDGGINFAEFQQGVAQAFEKLKAATPDKRNENPQHFSAAVMAGSVEAQRMLLESSSSNPMRTVETILKDAKEIETQQLETQRDTLDQLQKLGGGVLVGI